MRPDNIILISMIKQKKMKTPKGFRFSVVEGGIKYSGRKDMGLIVSDVEATAAGVFTRNRVKAAPVQLGIKRIRSGKAQAIIVNSGNANACTGEQGINDAIEMSKMAANQLGIKPSRTFVCSTGVIGTPMPMNKVKKGIKSLAPDLGKYSLDDVAKAMMTTDTFAKLTSRQIDISGIKVTITACVKGAGMICPNMATMLCFILTDAAIEQKALKSALKETVDSSFNCITIDGDMSTNDTVLALANGVAGNRTLTSTSIDFKKFKKALNAICLDLAEMIVSDGEGATKVIEIEVKGAKTVSDAKKAAKTVANSPLVKTALYGNDANWGRIMAAIGYSGISFNVHKVDIFLDNLQIVKNSTTTAKDKTANRLLKKKNIKILINLHSGHNSSRVLTCDLTEEYIKINAEYKT